MKKQRTNTYRDIVWLPNPRSESDIANTASERKQCGRRTRHSTEHQRAAPCKNQKRTMSHKNECIQQRRTGVERVCACAEEQGERRKETESTPTSRCVCSCGCQGVRAGSVYEGSPLVSDTNTHVHTPILQPVCPLPKQSVDSCQYLSCV